MESNLQLKIVALLAQKSQLATDQATEIIVKEVKKKYHIYTTRDDNKSEMWVYSEGIYIPEGETRVKEICREILKENYRRTLASEVIAKISEDTRIDQKDFFINENINEIAVNNGVLNIFTKELTEFSPTKIFFSKLSMNYIHDSDCPNIKKFLKDITLEGDDILLHEIIGYCLYREYKFENAFMLLGDGRNGKGKFMDLLKKFIGAENCSSVPLSQLSASSTSVGELFGRLVNLAGDIGDKPFEETDYFKQLTGRDLITAKRKYKRDLFFTNYAKMIFACNNLPRVNDTSKGFWERWKLIKFPYTFVKEEEYRKAEDKTLLKIRDEDIISKIVTKEEMEGLLCLALEALNKIIKKKDFTYPKGAREVQEIWIRNSNPFLAFCMDTIKEGYGSRISKKKIRNLFAQYCKEHNVRGASDKAIKYTLENHYGAYEKLDNILGERFWEGVGLKQCHKEKNDILEYMQKNRDRIIPQEEILQFGKLEEVYELIKKGLVQEIKPGLFQWI